MTDPVSAACLAAGFLVLAWVTGFGFGRFKRFVVRIIYKSSL